jgi:hypothetical protein
MAQLPLGRVHQQASHDAVQVKAPHQGSIEKLRLLASQV